jgi:hypothetical protein
MGCSKSFADENRQPKNFEVRFKNPNSRRVPAPFQVAPNFRNSTIDSRRIKTIRGEKCVAQINAQLGDHHFSILMDSNSRTNQIFSWSTQQSRSRQKKICGAPIVVGEAARAETLLSATRSANRRCHARYEPHKNRAQKSSTRSCETSDEMHRTSVSEFTAAFETSLAEKRAADYGV